MAKLTKRVGENITYNQERKIECSVYCDECSQGTANCKTVREMVKKLADYEDAEEQRLFLRLPCKVGDTIFYLNRKLILEYKVTGFAVDRTGAWLVYVEHYADKKDKTYGYNFDVGKIGKTVFLTKEEAEQALKDMESEG